MITSYEIEFLPVGNGEKSGDCILFHYFEDGIEKIIAYDGGTRKSGEAMVAHIKKYYGTQKIDYLINSHPDGDHVSGLIYVLENMDVGEVWIHQPWKYSDEILDLFHDGRMTANSLSERMKEKLRMAHCVYELAEEKSIPIYEPYAGAQIGPFTVLSPDKEWYINTLVPDFSKTPTKAKLVIEKFVDSLESFAETVKNILREAWNEENLPNNVETSAENDSSVILYADILNKGILLTGDSGVKALTKAAEYAENHGLQIQEYIKFVQVPHHGSRRNVSTESLASFFSVIRCVLSLELKLTSVSSPITISSILLPPKSIINNYNCSSKTISAQSHFSLRNKNASFIMLVTLNPAAL